MVERAQQLDFILQYAFERCEANFFDVMPLDNFDSDKGLRS
jgi:hypothetical protein